MYSDDNFAMSDKERAYHELSRKCIAILEGEDKGIETGFQIAELVAEIQRLELVHEFLGIFLRYIKNLVSFTRKANIEFLMLALTLDQIAQAAGISAEQYDEMRSENKERAVDILQRKDKESQDSKWQEMMDLWLEETDSE